MLAAETVYEALRAGRDPAEEGALDGYAKRIRRSEIWRDLRRVRNMRQAINRGLVLGAPLAGAMDVTRGRFPPGRRLATHRDADADLFHGESARRYPEPDGRITFDKLSSVYLSGNKTRDDAPPHIRVQHRVRREVAEAWVNMCPAQVYEITGDASPAGNVVTVEVTASNCVQCGAISAKGGRLTPGEGGSGPEYREMCPRRPSTSSRPRRPSATASGGRRSSRRRRSAKPSAAEPS